MTTSQSDRRSTQNQDAMPVESPGGTTATAAQAVLAPARRSKASMPDDCNATDAAYPQEQCLHRLFEQQVRAHPEAIALSNTDHALRYAELNRRANRLAHRLIELGLRPDERVALCVARGFAAIVGLLAVLKAGGAYVPFDPGHSSARLAQTLADAAPMLLLCDAAGRDALGETALHGRTVLDPGADLAGEAPEHDPQVAQLASHHLAYVIYTSGSTGTPKGVMIEHRNAVHLAHTQIARLRIAAHSRVAQFASLGFDASVLEIVMALCSGAALYLPSARQRESAEAFVEYMNREAISHVLLPPAFLQDRHYRLDRRPVLILGGEAPSPALVRSLACQATVVNAYGPTEITVCATMWTAPEQTAELDSVPIGRPLANTRVYLLDEARQPVPQGEIGELYIGGAGVARGYLGRPELTAERFLPDPFSPHRDARMYRSGDLARRLPDGNLVFVGRNDDQIKLRGYRIELGEIEARLGEHPAVRQCAVLAREDRPGEPRLVAYCLATDEPDAAASDILIASLRDHVRERLPGYMVPAAFVLMQTLPLTGNGKIDRKTLPAPPDEAFARRAYRAPQGPTETALASLWQSLLGIERVGRDDQFFELGGHSLIAARLLSRVREELGVTLPLAELFAHPLLAALAEAIDAQRAHHTETALPDILAGAREDDLPLSFAQRRLWFLAQLEHGDDSYNMPLILQLRGELDSHALQRSLDRVFARHQALRSVFRADDGHPQASLLPADAGLRMHEHDLRGRADARAELARLSALDARTPFDLAQGPLIRARLIRLGDDEHRLAITQHHIVCDGWSMHLLAREISQLYAAFREQGPDPLPPLSVQYPDYAAWEQRWQTGERLQAQADYWRGALADAPTLLALPTDRPRPPLRSSAAAAHPLHLDAELTRRLKRLSQAHGATLFMTLAAAWATVLARLSGQDDLVIGTPSANRGRREIEPLIGFFVNTLALRIDLSGEPDTTRLLARVRETALAAQAHQDLPFERVVEIVQPTRRMDHTPLFQALFAWQSNEPTRFDLPRLQVHAEQPFDAIRFDLELHLREHGDSVDGHLGYATALFDAATIERHAGYLIAALRAMTDDAHLPVSRIELLSSAEREHLLESANPPAVAYPDAPCVHELFEQQVRRDAHAVALIHHDRTLTYAELNARANALAHRLIEHGVVAGDRVALCVERGFEMVVGLLAALKAGAAYVPLDTTYPGERLSRVLTDSAPAAVLIDAVGRGALGAAIAADPRAIDLDTDIGIDAREDDPRIAGLRADHPAYVIYTSGSTGVPKGVAMPHAPLVNLIRWQLAELAPARRILQFAAIGFDVAFQEIFGALCSGAGLVLIDAQTRLNFPRLVRWIGEHAVERVHLPYIAAQSLAEAVDDLADDELDTLRDSLRDVIVAGEQLRLTPQIKRLFRRLPDCRLHNHYGPTETHVATAYVLGGDIEQAPSHAPIGRPIANARVYLLDRHGQPVPTGAAGELFIGGAAVAQGYLDRADLTAQRFVRDPFADDTQARMYRTGDLARYLSDGNLSFLGRNDHQVKIRGFRIELGEIEACLSEHEAVLECAVLAREDALGRTRLIAYTVAAAADGVDGDWASRLRGHLSARLPEYMVPAAFVALDALPVTPNGKLDTRALPEPDAEAFARGDYAPPQGRTECVLAELWQELLGVERIGRHDQFFELGGHSLIAVRLISRIGAAFAVELPLATLFAQPVLRDLAAAIDALPAQSPSAIGPAIASRARGADDGRLPLSFAQQRLWFLSQFYSVSANYHIPLALRLRGELDVDALQRSLDRLIARHEGLRSVFVAVDGQPHVEVLPADTGIALIEQDLRGDADPAATLRRSMTEEIDAPFDLARGPLLRARLIRLGAQDHVFLLTQHHIVSDGWSIGVLLAELSAVYSAFSQGRDDPLAPLPVQYPDYALWQRRWLQGERTRVQADYWRGALAGAPGLLSLPLDRPRPPQQSFDAAFVPIELDPALVWALKRVSQRHGSTLFMTLMAAWAIVLARLSGQDDLVIGAATAGRNRGELEPLIGFFVNTLALRIDLSGQPRPAELIARVRRATLDAQAHQDLPFEQVVESLQLSRRMDHTPLFQVMFAWQNNEEGTLDLPGIACQTEPYPFAWSKFDLELVLAENDGRIRGGLNYATALFDAASIERHRDYLLAALNAVADDADRDIARIELLPPREREQVLHDWNRTDADYDTRRCLHQLFEQQAQRDPQAVALFHDGHELSYGELNSHANRLAHHLIELGVRPDDRVALCAERGFPLIVGLLAVLKAGGAYLPFDPAYSSARLAQILGDAAPVLALCDRAGGDALRPAAPAALPMLDLVDDAPLWAERPWTDPRVDALNSRHLAYVIYTSGSTGTPKGVMVEHRNAMHLAATQVAQLQLSAHSRVLQFASIGFDASVFDIVMTFVSGGTLYLPTPAQRETATSVLAYLAANGITHSTLPPAVLQGHAQWPRWSVRPTLLLGGEAPSPALVRALSEQATVINAYGPTEITVCASAWTATREALAADPDTIPIGTPLANTRLYLLDEHRQPVPIGAVGELYIGGAGVARGYLNRPDLTAERFLPDPFSPHPDARMYRSGDLARHRGDGQLLFLGRNDHQVKLRGFRIEPGEIEARLAEHAAVRECVVLARQDTPGDPRLVAYIVAEDGAQTADELAAALRGHLSERLPDYMIPAAFVGLDALPLNASGKVDRKALPAPADANFVRGVYAAPQGDVETRLAALWQALLAIERVGRLDHFFELGGHSLRAVHLAARLRQEFSVDVAVRDVFIHPVFKDMAALLQPATGAVRRQLDLAAEARLDPAIRAVTPHVPVPRPDHVLLTGASGFLGGFLLASLLRRTSAVVHCLIRCSDAASGRRKLEAALQALGLSDQYLRERVVVVPGDLAKPLLGLSAQAFAELAGTVAAIYHNGAWVNSLHTYETLKAANVSGTEEVMRLACTGSLKHVHYISTLSTMPTIDAVQRPVADEEELFECWQGLSGGYAQSKWVAEQLLRAGGERGLPFTVYRPTHIAGSSRDGACNVSDTWSLFVQACLRLGCAPDIDVRVNSMPVDRIADAIVELSLRDDVAGRSLNLSHPRSFSLKDWIDCLTDLPGMDPVKRPYAQWLRLCADDEAGRNLASILPADLGPEAVEYAAYGNVNLGNAIEAMVSEGYACPEIESSLLRKYSNWLHRNHAGGLRSGDGKERS
ncbi:amino acid adenylation domain-containing protein [Lysobacter sp. CA199]|uniref:non-ribosomal peptide synthetase n=1 Tax=Lysobacter sp. CA199 TaxID=3455608 RepID=UPI003F8D2FDA